MQTVWMRWLVRQGSSWHTHTHKKNSAVDTSVFSQQTHTQHSYTFTSNLRYCNTTPTNFQSPQNKSTGLTWWRRSRTLVNRWQAQRSAWVQDNFTTHWLKSLWKTSQLLSTRDFTCTKRHHRVSLVVRVTVDRSSSRCGMHATKTLDFRKVEAQVSTWFSCFNLCGRRRTFWTSACARSSSGRGGAQRTRQSPGHSRGIVGVVRIRSGRNAVARSTWNFSGGFPVPALMVENRFQALPETSNRRFSSAEISGTGLICDWQNFWEKKKLIYRNNAMWQVGKRNKDLSRKAPYVSERPHMFQKGPICFKRTPYVWKRDPYVAHMLCFLKDFLPHMLKKLHMLQNRSPYVAHLQPICGPYVSAAVVLAHWTGHCTVFLSRDAIVFVGSLLEKHFDVDFTPDQEK